MAEFQFRLEPVLRQRAAKEVSAEQALARAHNDYNRRLTLLEDTRQRLEETAAPAGKSESELDIFEVMHLSFYRTSLSAKISDQEKGVRKAGLMVEDKRNEAIQVRQDRQVMEKLRDKHLQNYRREAALREQKEVDELALYAHLRRVKQLRPRPV